MACISGGIVGTIGDYMFYSRKVCCPKNCMPVLSFEPNPIVWRKMWHFLLLIHFSLIAWLDCNMRNEDVFWTDPRKAYNDPKLKNGIVGLFAPGNGRGFSGCGSAPGSPLWAPGWNLARRSTGPHQLILLSLISPDMRRESSSCCWCTIFVHWYHYPPKIKVRKPRLGESRLE